MKSNVADLIRRNRARALDIRKNMGGAARIIAPVLEQESKRILRDRIYSVRIPVSRTGRALWRARGCDAPGED